MRTLMLIFNTPEARAEWQTLTADEQEADTQLHRDWFGRHRTSVTGGEELGSPEAGRILRRKSGRVIVTDGPFAETRESLGGFVILDTADMAAAEGIAAEWPGIDRWDARVELRPIPG
jgi:hypothetical protein